MNKLKTEVNALNHTVDAQKEEIKVLKTVVEKHGEEIQRAVTVEKDLHKQTEIALKAKCSKLRKMNKEVIDSLQLKLTKVQQRMAEDNSDNEGDINMEDDANSQLYPSDSDSYNYDETNGADDS